MEKAMKKLNDQNCLYACHYTMRYRNMFYETLEETEFKQEPWRVFALMANRYLEGDPEYCWKDMKPPNWRTIMDLCRESDQWVGLDDYGEAWKKMFREYVPLAAFAGFGFCVVLITLMAMLCNPFIVANVLAGKLHKAISKKEKNETYDMETESHA